MTIKGNVLVSLFLALLCFSYAVSPLFKDFRGTYFEEFQHIDGRTLYVSGVCWLSGRSPYTPAHFRQVWNETMHNEARWATLGETDRFAFVYPPTVGILTIPLALFSWDVAKYLLDIINVFALFFIALFSTLLLRLCTPLQNNPTQLISATTVGLFVHTSVSTPILLLGQTSLLVHVGCLGAIYCFFRERFVLAGLFLVLASIKPYMSLFLVVYLLLQSKDARFLIWSFIFVGITTFLILVLGRDSNPLPELQASLTTYSLSASNSNALLPGMQVILHTMKVNSFIISLMPVVGLIITLIFSLKQRKDKFKESTLCHTQAILMIAFIFVITAVFMPIHVYDYTLLFLMFSSLLIVKWYVALILLPGVLLTTILPIHLKLFGLLITPILMKSWSIIYLALVLATILVTNRGFSFNETMKSKNDITT